MIGKVMFVSGASMFLTAPVVGRMATKFDPRIMLAAGFLIFALSNWQLTGITTDWDFAQVFLPQVLRGIGLMFAIVPITNLALGTLPPERLKNASGLYNLTRNLGGAVGLAGLNTVLDNRMDLHFARLHDAITWSRQSVMESLQGMTARMPGSDAHDMALKQLFMLVHQQGVVMAFADVFLLLAVLFAVFAPLAIMMRRPAADAGAAGGH